MPGTAEHPVVERLKGVSTRQECSGTRFFTEPEIPRSVCDWELSCKETMLCGHYIGIDRLERSKLLQGDPLDTVFEISVKQPDRMTVSDKFR